MMAQCTPLDTLNQIISENPNDGPPRRTRALTRIFKEDYVNSAQDLTDALRTARYNTAQHRAGNDQLVLARSMQEQHGRDWRQEAKIPDEDQPNSLEAHSTRGSSSCIDCIVIDWSRQQLPLQRWKSEQRRTLDLCLLFGHGLVVMLACQRIRVQESAHRLDHLRSWLWLQHPATG